MHRKDQADPMGLVYNGRSRRTEHERHVYLIELAKNCSGGCAVRKEKCEPPCVLDVGRSVFLDVDAVEGGARTSTQWCFSCWAMCWMT